MPETIVLHTRLKAGAAQAYADAWQARMAAFLEIEDDYGGNDSGVPLLWELP